MALFTGFSKKKPTPDEYAATDPQQVGGGASAPSEQSAQSVQSDRLAQSDRSDQLNQPDKPDQSGQSAQSSEPLAPTGDVVTTVPGAEHGTELTLLDQKVVDAIRTCYDPEIPVDIYELGLIYQIRVKAHGAVYVMMTLTSPSCPAAQSLPAEVKMKIEGIQGVSEATVEVVWDPPWSPARMTEAARLELGLF